MVLRRSMPWGEELLLLLLLLLLIVVLPVVVVVVSCGAAMVEVSVVVSAGWGL